MWATASTSTKVSVLARYVAVTARPAQAALTGNRSPASYSKAPTASASPRVPGSARRANHQLAGGEILLLAMRQEIIHPGIQHLGKRGVLPEVLAEVGQQVVRWL